MPQITLRGVGGPSKALLYADADTDLSCLFYIRGNHRICSGPNNPIIQFSGLAFRNDTRFASRRNSIVCYRHHSYRKIFRMNDCHATLRCIRRLRQDLLEGPVVVARRHEASLYQVSHDVRVVADVEEDDIDLQSYANYYAANRHANMEDTGVPRELYSSSSSEGD